MTSPEYTKAIFTDPGVNPYYPDSRPNKPMQPTPLRGNKIVGILESHFVLTLIPFYKAARLMGNPLDGIPSLLTRDDILF